MAIAWTLVDLQLSAPGRRARREHFADAAARLAATPTSAPSKSCSWLRSTRPARDSIAAQRQDWLHILERLAREARQLDELARSLAPEQLAFELQALLAAANTTFSLNGDAEVFERAWRAVRERIH